MGETERNVARGEGTDVGPREGVLMLYPLSGRVDMYP